MNKVLCDHPDCVSPLLSGPKNAVYECRICDPKRPFCHEHITDHEHRSEHSFNEPYVCSPGFTCGEHPSDTYCGMPLPNTILTEDKEYVRKGDRVFNYYGMKYCTIAEDPDREGWFSTTNDDGSRGDVLNGERICSVAYAERRFPNA